MPASLQCAKYIGGGLSGRMAAMGRGQRPFRVEAGRYRATCPPAVPSCCYCKRTGFDESPEKKTLSAEAARPCRGAHYEATGVTTLARDNLGRTWRCPCYA